ncbi:hypothetical protein EJ02DRAFT_439656 [Clathrospora elynae]|uniref:Rhodopsin domain-containing protein n=1 Tax=Clathrospora elynae TaxID=706981 RepID=A0A6A5S5V9_9PLEO|nr:hypothetical protein EJ02DRAFT_439656 [Clathrospora elynae]
MGGRTLIFQCVPVAAAWDIILRPPPLGAGSAKCFSGQKFSRIGLFNGVINILTDFLVAFIPVSLVWKLQMPLRPRTSLVIILSLGVFAAVAGIIRQQSSKQFLDPEPWIHDSYTIWNFIELYMGIIAALLPALKPMFSWFSNAAKSITKLTKKDKFRNRTAGGYYKHTQPEDTDGFAMVNCGPLRKVTISLHPVERDKKWDLGLANNSEERILPCDQEEQKLGGIMVTKRVQVE